MEKLRLFAGLKSPIRFAGKRAGMSQVIKNPFLSLDAISYCQVRYILVSLVIPFFCCWLPGPAEKVQREQIS